MNKDKGFLFFYDWMPAFESLNPKDFKDMIIAMCNYQKDGTPPPEFSNKAKAIATFVFPHIDRRRHMSEIGKKGAEALHSRASTSAFGQSDANGAGSGKAKASVTAQDKVKDKSKSGSISESNKETAEAAKEDDGSADARRKEEGEIFSEEKGGRSVTDSSSEDEATSAEAETDEPCRDGSAQYKYGWGTHNNVYLSTEQYLALRRLIPAADRYIDRFSEKLAQKGYRYPDHFAAISDWWERDRKLESGRALPASDPHPEDGGSFDTDEFFEAAVKRSLGECDAGC